MAMKQPSLPPKKDPIYRLQPPSPTELDDWDHSMVGQFADTGHFSPEEVREVVNLFWQSRGHIGSKKGQGDKPISHWRFNDTALWVQIHNIAPLYHNSTNALGLARLIGDPIKKSGKIGHREQACNTSISIASQLLEQKYTQFELGQLLMKSAIEDATSLIASERSPTPFLTSRVDLLEPDSPNYGPAPIYGYGDGPSEGDTSSDSSDGGTAARPPSQFRHSATFARADAGPSRQVGGRPPCPCLSNSAPPHQGYRGNSLHEHPTAFHTQGPTNNYNDHSFPYNPYS
ncbi:hypothetical protein Cgig2_018897 [Carnegiea gigantea]|uniref:Uncharacterized protein n=1 Tax=Carnegiea gigantea TaxID=171969 RepID=A0A9Q1K7Y1_9CARY|nr:hypothetical protein Cgig2_018897 [Carnegiea gigantea]